MSGRIFKGYGRGWGEDKAPTPVARFFQIMREPCSANSMYIIVALCAVMQVAAIILLMMMGRS